MHKNKFQGFENLKVWKTACQLSVETYAAFRELKDFGFKDQVCRASVSIPSNIAEGYERNGQKEFIRFLNIAKGSCGEFKTQIYIALKIGYLEQATAHNLLNMARHIAAMLSSLINSITSRRKNE